MKRTIVMKLPFVAIIIALMIMTTACSQATNTDEGQEEGPVYRKISVKEARDMIKAGGVRIIDVREPSEFAEGHVPDAELLPLGDISKAEPSSVLTDKDEVLLVYCRSGRRSAEAAKKLVAYGYTQVYDFGGILDWPYEVVK